MREEEEGGGEAEFLLSPFPHRPIQKRRAAAGWGMGEMGMGGGHPPGSLMNNNDRIVVVGKGVD